MGFVPKVEIGFCCMFSFWVCLKIIENWVPLDALIIIIAVKIIINTGVYHISDTA